jgi:hypothetical protein
MDMRLQENVEFKYEINFIKEATITHWVELVLAWEYEA